MESVYKFPAAIILKISGEHAPRYLQSRFTNNLNLLTEGNSIWTAALSPQGKTEGLFILSKVASDFFLSASGGNPEQVVKSVKRFIVADKVNVETLSEHSLIHILTENSGSLLADKECITYNANRIKSPGKDLIIKSNDVDKTIANLRLKGFKILNNDEYHQFKVINCTPDFPDDIHPDSLFAEAQMEAAISRTKGCYAGQEVVERLSALGTLPASIMAGYVNGKISKAAEVIAEAALAGEILSSSYAPDSDKTYIFIRLRKNFKDKDLTIKTAEENLSFFYL